MINCVTSDLEIEDNDFGENKLEICRLSVAQLQTSYKPAPHLCITDQARMNWVFNYRYCCGMRAC